MVLHSVSWLETESSTVGDIAENFEVCSWKVESTVVLLKVMHCIIKTKCFINE